jgi:succinyl-diaminopimelate desuccinylase
MNTRELMEQLIAMRPVSAEVDNVNRAVDCLTDFLVSHGLHTQIEKLGSRKILYAATAAQKHVELLFNAHVDVVPGEDEQFEPREENGWIVGRGTHDCLGNCAVVAQALVKAAAEGHAAGAVFSTDEEIGGKTTLAMVERGYAARRLVVIVDGSGYSLINAQKGVLVLTLRAKGKECHAAEPWKGDNAIDRLLDGYAKVRDLFPPVTPPDEWHNTLAATMLHAGTVHNKVPEAATMTLNIRFTENVSPESIVEQIEARSGLTAILDMQSPPVFCSEADPQIGRLRKIMARVLGRAIDVKRSNGATDARHFVDMQVPIAIIGVPGRDLHGRDEAVELAGLDAYEAVLGELIRGTEE